MMIFQIVCVAPHLAREFLPIVAGMLDAGYAADDEAMPGDLADRLEAKTLQLWVAVPVEGMPVAAMLTELTVMRSGLYCRMMQCGGESMLSWRHMVGKIEEYARAEGCVKVVFGSTRARAWSRVLPGYSEMAVSFEKVL